MLNLRSPRQVFSKDERGVSMAIEFLIYVPLAIMFIGFILNSAFHWMTSFYMQGVVNDAASYTAAAGGDVRIAYVPNGGFDLKPTEYIARQAATNRFVLNLNGVQCAMVSGQSSANGIARCSATYTTLVFPTDPFSSRGFSTPMTLIAEDVAQTAYNPNLS